MARENLQAQSEDKTKLWTLLAVFTLLPLPLGVLLEVLIGIAFWMIPNSGNAPGWIGSVLEGLCCAPFIGSILLAIIGEILYLTAWRTHRRVWMKILMWINPILIGMHVLIVGYIFYELTYANPFTF